MREVTGCLLAQCNVWKPLVFCRIQHGVLYHVASNLFIPYQRPAGKPCVLFGFFFSSLPHRCWSGLLTKSLNPCLPQYDSHLGGTPIRGKHDDSKERKKEITNVYHRIPCNSPPLASATSTPTQSHHHSKFIDASFHFFPPFVWRAHGLSAVVAPYTQRSPALLSACSKVWPCVCASLEIQPNAIWFGIIIILIIIIIY